MNAVSRDKDIRKHLLENTFSRFFSKKDTVVVNELDLCQGMARVDIAVVNGYLHGYEIKSDADSLSRINSQAEIYNKVLEKVTVVSGTRHIEKLIVQTPIWWGITEVKYDGFKVVSKILRTPTINKEIDIFYLCRLLWKSEALGLLEKHGKSIGCLSKNKFFLWKKIANEIPEQEIKNYVRESLKKRYIIQAG